MEIIYRGETIKVETTTRNPALDVIRPRGQHFPSMAQREAKGIVALARLFAS